VRDLLARIGATLQLGKSPWLDRIASRSGDKVEPIDLRRVTHFFSKDKLTFAATLERSHVVDMTISELEQKLDPGRFIRIHRGTILNLDHLLELHGMFGGRMLARLKDGKKTELAVSRDRVAALKDRLGLFFAFRRCEARTGMRRTTWTPPGRRHRISSRRAEVKLRGTPLTGSINASR
jgi:DNA-binding LytR/AlgR family response regulator